MKNPMNKVDPIKTEKVKKKAYDLMDLEKIRLGCRGNREKAIVETLASTWCRVSELVGIRIDAIEGNKILVKGKGAKERYCFLNARAKLAITQLKPHRSIWMYQTTNSAQHTPNM